MLCNVLSSSYKEALCSGKLSVSQRRGTISLIPKNDCDFMDVSSWRPITLFCKLLKVIAKRIAIFSAKLIHSEQTGFVKGRYIGQNIRLLNDIMEYSKFVKLPRILIFF